MYTPTLGEIRTAITTNNRKQAMRMLQTHIKQKPTADAWYLASQLTNERKKKLQYLRAALLLDKGHHKSLASMRDLGESVGGDHNILFNSIIHELQEQADKSPFLRHFSPMVQAIIGLGLTIFLVLMMGIMVSKLTSSSGLMVNTDGVDIASTELAIPSQVFNAFSTSSLDILSTDQTRDEAIGKNIITLDIRDKGNRSRQIEIFVYDSVQAILADQNHLSTYESNSNMIAHSNIIAVYPHDLSEPSAVTIANVVQGNQANGGA